MGLPKPGVKTPLKSAVEKCPMPDHIELYNNSATGWAPAEKCDNKANLKYMEILRGSHTAVTYVGASGLGDIHSNNPANAVPDDRAWVDTGKGNDRRSIFFFGKRAPNGPGLTNDDRRQDQSTLFFSPGCSSTLQVWVRDYKDHFVYVKLFGPCLELNSPGVPPYQLGHTLTVGDDWPPEKIIAEVQRRTPLTHLVINTHATTVYNTRSTDDLHPETTKIWLGSSGFDMANIDLWATLANKIKYIWLWNCKVGTGNLLPGSIAKQTRAWVAAPSWSIGYRPKSVPSGHIEYFSNPLVKTWNGSTIAPSDTVLTPALDMNDFFFSARYSAVPSLGEDALYFNIVRSGESLPGKKK